MAIDLIFTGAREVSRTADNSLASAIFGASSDLDFFAAGSDFEEGALFLFFRFRGDWDLTRTE